MRYPRRVPRRVRGLHLVALGTMAVLGLACAHPNIEHDEGQNRGAGEAQDGSDDQALAPVTRLDASTTLTADAAELDELRDAQPYRDAQATSDAQAANDAGPWRDAQQPGLTDARLPADASEELVRRHA